MSHEGLEFLQRRTVRVLTAGQVLSGFGLGSTLSIGALLAEHISGTAAWSGAAATFSTLGAAAWAIPLSRIAYSLGRRKALATGAAFAISGAGLVILAAATMQLWILLVALFLLGAGAATGLQARFAATDLPSSRPKGRDLSTVVWATTFGAVIGPNLFGPGEILGNALGLPEMTGPFLITIVAQLAATLTFWFGLRPDPLLVAMQADPEAVKRTGKRSFGAAIKTLRAHPRAAYAVLAISLSHMVMVSVMSMTPVHMKDHGATLVLVGFTISLHIAGMYAFSPIFGWLSDRIGKLPTILLGQARPNAYQHRPVSNRARMVGCHGLWLGNARRNRASRSKDQRSGRQRHDDDAGWCLWWRSGRQHFGAGQIRGPKPCVAGAGCDRGASHRGD